ncbi:MAG: zinc-ribbon domain-containing protein [Paludibacteraceae bacterium]|nr:zinc-ribbon domain-containing protein [Paludibacteraceae bacterium]
MKIIENSEIFKYWDFSKNEKLNPENLSCNSHVKAWWICENGHSWERAICNAYHQSSRCPFCNNKRISEKNNLKNKFTEIATEWDFVRNDENPENYFPYSNKKVWWLCKKGHSYESTINNRTSLKQGCPYCAGQRASANNNFKVMFPKISEEIDLEKHPDADLSLYTSGSDHSFWWKCKHGHSFKSTIGNRSRGRGCPFCYKGSSKFEMRVFSELKRFYKDAERQNRTYKTEMDIYLPSLNIAIEVDGSYWHKNKEVKDREKNSKLESKNIYVIRLRELPLCKISEYDILFNYNTDDFRAIFDLFYMISKISETTNPYEKEKCFTNETEYLKLISETCNPKRSLIVQRPLLINEWDFIKNQGILPQNFSFGSDHEVWWTCSRGHSYLCKISLRSNGRGCPFCSGKRVYEGNSFQYNFPQIAEEWDFTKNVLKPTEVTKSSNKKFGGNVY